jgi:8-oxo-dGTP pyrophosphatase MutT (NUDIX family)
MSEIQEKIDLSVEVFIVYKNKVLLHKHDKVKLWLSIGGKIEQGENPANAGKREVKEEVGLDVEIIGYKPNIENEFDYTHIIGPKYMANWQRNESNRFVVFVYFARANTDVISDSKMEHERSETRWVTKEELPTMGLRPNIEFYATEALKEIGEE